MIYALHLFFIFLGTKIPVKIEYIIYIGVLPKFDCFVLYIRIFIIRFIPGF